MTKDWTPIGLTDPLTRGPHVSQAQRLLNANPFGDLFPGKIDGIAGPQFFGAVHHAKWLLGFTKKAITPLFGQELRDYLSGDTKLPKANLARRKSRLAAQNSDRAKRDKMVAICNWAIAHEPQISYAQARPIPIGLPFEHLPLDTDCSGSTIIFGHWAGFPTVDFTRDWGSSASLGADLPHIPKEAVQPGDLVCWPGHHVAVVLVPGTDPTLESHGQESGPDRISLSAEAAWHSSHGDGAYVFLRSL